MARQALRTIAFVRAMAGKWGISVRRSTVGRFVLVRTTHSNRIGRLSVCAIGRTSSVYKSCCGAASWILPAFHADREEIRDSHPLYDDLMSLIDRRPFNSHAC
jgi:hypothetical protein